MVLHFDAVKVKKKKNQRKYFPTPCIPHKVKTVKSSTASTGNVIKLHQASSSIKCMNPQQVLYNNN